MKRKKGKKRIDKQVVHTSRSFTSQQIRWMATGISILIIAGILAVIAFNMPRKLAENDVRFLNIYEQIRVALAADNLDRAKDAAKPLAKESEPLGSAATRLMASTTLDSARNEFKVLSEHAVLLAKDQPGFYVMQCIAPCPVHCLQCPMGRFGKWVQQTAEVNNPYMGSAGIGCGRISDL